MREPRRFTPTSWITPGKRRPPPSPMADKPPVRIAPLTKKVVPSRTQAPRGRKLQGRVSGYALDVSATVLKMLVTPPGLGIAGSGLGAAESVSAAAESELPGASHPSSPNRRV